MREEGSRNFLLAQISILPVAGVPRKKTRGCSQEQYLWKGGECSRIGQGRSGAVIYSQQTPPPTLWELWIVFQNCPELGGAVWVFRPPYLSVVGCRLSLEGGVNLGKAVFFNSGNSQRHQLSPPGTWRSKFFILEWGSGSFIVTFTTQ